MSHFTQIRTEIKDVDALVKALTETGFQHIEVHETAQPLYGYQGDLRPDTAEIIIRRQYIGRASNDIGFKRQENGGFTAIISEYDRHKYSQQWLNGVMQRYAYHALMAQAPLQGFAVEQEETLADGTIRIVLAKWV
ncbi:MULTISPECIES: DUF1257 domain-containing protein [unclassified Leptolyngbya]|uniref:DUF1257 domain-containing protein n=1 Tax=unclassified Leptolyngbya TaxID=2650499 RepID=UPI001687F0F4|nr:DUF1257 domain-containing protein [Leptolyngbya sp. FACHB-8]MBD2152976.1 DUF1257 domain-containing protein [Leptolyngbya sp. FACHB-16]